MTASATLRQTRHEVLEFLRAQYLGPANGPEEVLHNRPDRVYLVGSLYPRGAAADQLDGDTLGDDVADEALDDQVELANSWHPASTAVSFLHDGETIEVHLSAARYVKDDPSGTWQRIPLSAPPLRLVPPTDPSHEPHRRALDDRARVTGVWRRQGSRWLVTVAVENSAVNTDPSSPPPTEDCLFQVYLSCRVVDGSVLPYPSSDDLDNDHEEAELRLLYRHKQNHGAGHGCSVTWTPDDDGVIRTVATEMMPATRVPGVSADQVDAPAPTMAFLADEEIAPDLFRDSLERFIDAYAQWVEDRAHEADELPHRHTEAGTRLVQRMRRAVGRMRDGLEVLLADETLLRSFRLANAAMRDQFLQTSHVRTSPGRLYDSLPSRPEPAEEPAWKPFQLAFLLLSIPSTSNASHPDRELVDLIWFPTGGGKTEAYLGLAAFEMIRRRLKSGLRGGGTAVLTRYTLRLLTAQQLQRAAALVCALQILRQAEPDLRGTPEFTIGLWVGGETTPNSYADASDSARELRRAQRPENPFQVQACPWCGTRLFPERRTNDDAAYGVRATKYSFELFCPHPDCLFHDNLPVEVVDEQIFADPPSMLVGTVDKFARLPWLADAGSVLGQGNVPFEPPSLVIQDELHLLSGPLGTTVAVYEAAVQAVLGWEGDMPKIVASTATIRAAGHQVRGLYGRDVALFPPSGLNADNSFFAKVDETSPGRLYVGLMPQAHTASYATVLTTTALLQAPVALGLDASQLDAYWTVVAYHSSLRELGRTVTIARDDVGTLLKTRDRGDGNTRRLRPDGIIELTSNVKPGELLEYLARLERTHENADCVDLVATTNMLSVGIDIGRLGLMLMNGQPKTTSEYIQATSRVGRASTPGLVVTLLRASKPRDRSHYEGFRAYHEAFYRHVEPTSVTPWSLASRERSLHAALTLLVRHGCGLRSNSDAGRFRRDDPDVQAAVRILENAVLAADRDEAPFASDELRRLVGEWDRRAQHAADLGTPLVYATSPTSNEPALLRDFGQARDGWETMHSMRSVDRQVRVLALGEARP